MTASPASSTGRARRAVTPPSISSPSRTTRMTSRSATGSSTRPGRSPLRERSACTPRTWCCGRSTGHFAVRTTRPCGGRPGMGEALLDGARRMSSGPVSDSGCGLGVRRASRETFVELDTCVDCLTCPDVTFWTVLFETLTERLLFTCLLDARDRDAVRVHLRVLVRICRRHTLHVRHHMSLVRRRGCLRGVCDRRDPRTSAVTGPPRPAGSFATLCVTILCATVVCLMAFDASSSNASGCDATPGTSGSWSAARDQALTRSYRHGEQRARRARPARPLRHPPRGSAAVASAYAPRKRATVSATTSIISTSNFSPRFSGIHTRTRFRLRVDIVQYVTG